MCRVNAAVVVMARALMVVVGALVLLPGAAIAQTWNGSVSTDWNVPGNWTPNSVPGAGAAVIINTGTPSIPAASNITVSTLSLGGGTLTIAGSLNVTTTLTMAGGTMAGSGTGSVTWAGFSSTSSSSKLAGTLAVNNGLVLNNQSLKIGGTVTFSGGATLTNANLGYEGASMLFGADVVATGSNIGPVSLGVGTTTMTVGAGVTVRLRSGSSIGQFLFVGGGTSGLANNGTIIAETSGTSTIAGNVLTNSGSIGATGAGIELNVTSSAMVGSVGSVIFCNNSATVTIAGACSGSVFNGMTRSPANSGVVRLGGTYTNTALTLNGTTGDLQLNGGTITGGTVTQSGGSLRFTSSNANRLLAPLSIGGDVVGASGANLRISGAVVFSGDISWTNGDIGLENGTALSVGGGDVVMSGGTVGLVSAGAATSASIAAGTTVHLRAAASMGALVFVGGGTSVITNNGTIVCDGTGTSPINPSTFTNNGTVSADGSGAVLTVGGASTNWSGSPTGVVTVLNGGTVNLQGTFTGASLTNITRSPANTGTVAIVGTCNNTGNTITLTAATGDLTLNGGTLTGGSLAQSGGNLKFTTNQGSRLLAPLSVSGDVVGTGNWNLRISGNVAFAGDINWTGGSIGLENGTALGAGGGDVVMTGATLGLVSAGPATSVSIAAGTTVHLRGGADMGSLIFVGGGTSAITNNGTIVCDGAGTSIINPITFTNNGSLRADGGTSVLVVGSASTVWTGAPTSSIAVLNSGRVSLSGNFTGASIVNVSRTPANTGVLAVVGECNNAGNTITLTATTGNLTMDGGNITGGAITQSGAVLVCTTSSTNRLTAPLTFTGDLTLTSGNLSLFGSVAISGDITLNTSSNMGCTDGSTISAGGGDIFLNGGSTLGLRSVGVGVQTVTIAAGTTVHMRGGSNMGQFVFVGGGTSRIVNNGTIVSDATNQTSTINPNTFSNTGTISADGTGAILNLTTQISWTNAGTINVSNGGRVVLGNNGTFLAGTAFTRSPANTGSIAITGTITNTGNTITTNATTGDLSLEGGTIIGGQITQSGALFKFNSNASNRLADVTFNGNLVLVNANLTLAGTTFFTGTGSLDNSSLGVDGSGTVQFNGGTLALINGSILGIRSQGVAATNMLTIPAGLTISARQSSAIGQFVFVGGGTAKTVNNGTIISDLAASTVTLNGDEWTNNGTITANPGNITISPNVNPFASAGTMNVGGNGRLTINAGAWSSAGTINVSGNGRVDFGGTAVRSSIATINRTTPATNTIAVTGAINNTGSSIVLDGTTGSWLVDGGSITGGTVTQSGGSVLQFSTNSANRLTGPMTVSGDLVMNNGSLTIAGAVNFSGNGLLTNASLGYDGGGTMSFAGGTVDISSATIVGVRSQGAGAYTLTVPAGLTVQGAGSIGQMVFVGGGTSEVVNNGTIKSTVALQNISMNSTTMTNNGTLASEAGTMSIAASPFVNAGSGVLKASGAGVLTVSSAAWSGTGSYNLTNGGRINLGGAFTGLTLGNLTRSPAGTGVLAITGAMNNTAGSIPLTSTTGPVLVDGGAITGGSITQSGTGALQFTGNSNNRLIGPMTFGGDLVLTNGTVRVTGVVSFGGNATLGTGSTLGFDAGMTPSFAGGVISMTNAVVGVRSGGAGEQVLTIPAGLTIQGSGNVGQFVIVGGGTASLVNNGVLSANLSNSTLVISSNTFTNNGTVQAVGPTGSSISFSTILNNYNGATNTLSGGAYVLNSPAGGFQFNNNPTPIVRTIAPGTTVVLGGLNSAVIPATVFSSLTTVDGAFGVVNRRVFASTPLGGTFTNNGTVTVGTGGRLNVTGDYVQTSGATLVEQTGGNNAADYGQVSATGTAAVGGTLTVTYTGAQTTSDCASVPVVVSGAGTSVTVATTNLPVKQPVLQNGTRLQFGLQYLYYSSLPVDIADDAGTPGANGRVNEGDYNAFFQGFFDAQGYCDIADDQGTFLNDPLRDPLVPNSGVNEGDYNAFFAFFFSNC